MNQQLLSLVPDRLDFLARLERALPVVLAGSQRLERAARHLCCAAGAKRARPLLAFHIMQVINQQEGPPRVSLAATIDIATAVELMHSASLLHDDVIDEGKVRRGIPTVNALYGNITAVLSGDMVLARALSLLAPYGIAVTEKAIAVVAEMTAAAFAEVDARGNLELTIPAWRRIAEGKSGALFGASAALVALLAGDSALAAKLDRMGRHLGIAFQIADDVADLGGDALQAPLSDLRDGNPSFPLLIAAAQSPELARRMRECRPETLSEVARLVLRTEAIEVAQQAIAHEVASARLAAGAVAIHPALQEMWTWAAAMQNVSPPTLGATQDRNAS